MLNTSAKTKPVTPIKPERKVIYGITDRRDDPLFERINDFFIDHLTRVKAKEKTRFFHSLRLLVASGVRFTKALAMLAHRTQNEHFKRVLNTVVYDMEINGQSFSQSMQKFPDVFTQSEAKIIYSGEISGKIDETLESIAEQLQKNLELETRVRSALMYPFIVLVAIVLAALVIMIWVVPIFMNLFEEFDADLPWPTKILIGVSEFLQVYWWLAMTVVFGVWMIFRNWKQSEKGKHAWDRFLLEVPLFRGLINNIQTIRVVSNFGTLMHSGVPVTKALHILSQIMPNAIVRDGVFNVEQSVKKGMPINQSFKAEPVFDPVIGEVIEVGEQSGSISEVLAKTGEQYELEVDSQLKNLTSLIEPIIIVIVGISVVFLALAIMLPIFKMNDLMAAG